MNKSNTLRIEARSSPFAVPMRMNMIFVRNQQLTCLKCLLIFQPKPTNWCANHRCPYFVWGRARAPNLYAACGGQSFINNFRVIAIGKYHILYTLVWCTSNCSVSIYACVQTHGLVRRSADWTFFSCSESIPEQNDYLSNINEMHCNELVFRSLCEIVFWLMRWCIGRMMRRSNNGMMFNFWPDAPMAYFLLSKKKPLHEDIYFGLLMLGVVWIHFHEQ